ncbi:hypothetical protein EDB84DRAFT_1441574 [Lactarius hengduanensis]|nr:hypothetical protein EDB84DRAFT_1441574 [Lactarius hengduanensis]
MCNTKKIDETDLEVDKGPSHGCLMPLNLAQGSEIVDQQGFEGSAIKGKRQGGAGTPPPNLALTATPESPVPTVSHVNMDLVFVKGTTKIMLTNVTIAFAFTQDALITTTEKHGHGGGIVQCQLQVDGKYLTKLVSLQLSGYNYIFLGAPGNMGITGLVVQLLLCLVSITFSRHTKVKMVCLYESSYEWCGGAQQISEFSANTYLDMYLANVNTLKHILNNRERAFHIMMSNIYAQASPDWYYGNTTGGTATTTTPIANLDLDELK